nr:phosphopantetheine-binding domain-containing pro [uncultured bacterium]
MVFGGRFDDQVKIRGFRVEPGEVEAAVLAHPGVRAGVVVAGPGPGGTMRLVAYVVGDADPAELRGWLADRLPEHLRPAVIVPLDRLPITPNGKIDRAALPAPAAASTVAYRAPATPTEEAVAAVYREVLGVDRVGGNDDFFALGGHSLLATQAISRLRDTHHIHLPLKTIFEHPTVTDLAATIDSDAIHSASAQAGSDDAAADRIERIPRADRAGELPLSFAQERLWFLDRLEPASAAYNIPAALRIRGALDTAALQRAVDAVVRRHEPLRTTFAARDGRPVQVVHEHLRLVLETVDVSADPDPRASGQRHVDEVARHPFDLESGPLVRARLVRVADGEHLLATCMHHIVSDGWSLSVFLREVIAAYGAVAGGGEIGLPPLRIDYVDYAAFQRRSLAGDALQREIDWWAAELRGAPPALSLPTDWPRPALQSHDGAALTHVIDPSLRADVNRLVADTGSTLFMVALAAFDVVLTRWSGQDDVVVGVPIAGRNRREFEDLIGFFVNTLALRTRLDGDPTFRDLVARVRHAALGAFAHQEVPFEGLVSELGLERDLSRTPVFQVMLNMINLPGDIPDFPGLSAEMVQPGAVQSKFDLTLYAQDTPAGLQLDLVYNRALFAPGRMRELLLQFEAVLAQAAREPDAPLSRLSLVTAAAAARLPDPAAPLPALAEEPVHHLVAARAVAAPGQTAIDGPDGVVTYGELVGWADHVADALRGAGVAPGDVVAVVGRRHAALVAALLGAMRAGATFFVLDPAHPPARLNAAVAAGRPAAWLDVGAAVPVGLVLPDARVDVLTRRGGESGPAKDIGSALGDPDAIAYIAFTSGTEGHPLGVRGRHRPLAHVARVFADRFAVTPADRFSMLSGLGHDPLLRDVFVALASGATLCIPAEDDIGPGRLAAWFQRSGVTVAGLTPAMGGLLTSRVSPGGLPSLRLAAYVGEALRFEDVDALRSAAPRATVVNLYGTTETQQALGCLVVGRGGEGAVPIGPGLDGVQLLVATQAGGLAGVSELGEIRVRSAYLAAGYLDRPELDAVRFDGDAHTAVRSYRTGDLGRFRPDGTIEYASRVDGQLTLRGFRIEAGEVEAALTTFPGVGARSSTCGARATPAGWWRGSSRRGMSTPARCAGTSRPGSRRTWSPAS